MALGRGRAHPCWEVGRWLTHKGALGSIWMDGWVKTAGTAASRPPQRTSDQEGETQQLRSGGAGARCDGARAAVTRASKSGFRVWVKCASPKPCHTCLQVRLTVDGGAMLLLNLQQPCKQVCPCHRRCTAPASQVQPAHRF